MSHDLISYKVSYVSTVTGSVVFSVNSKGSDSNSVLIEHVKRYHSYLFNHPNTRLVITPLLNECTGELFNLNTKNY